MDCGDFDEQVVRNDKDIAALANSFVCLRIQSMNITDINRFKFDYDLTWMAFFMNSEGSVYCRYGGRDDRSADSYLSKTSLQLAMKTALQKHKRRQPQPDNRYEPRHTKEDALLGKQLPEMNAIMRRRSESCIHCHDIKNAQLRKIRSSGKLNKEMVFGYPSPAVLGVELDRDHQTTINSVAKDSGAYKAGLRTGDKIVALDEQEVFTFADATRILHLAKPSGPIAVRYLRNGQPKKTIINLEAGWRRSKDPSWRTSLNMIGPNAGFWGVPISPTKRKQLGIDAQTMAIRVTSIWGSWTKKSGIKSGDIIIEFDERTNLKTIRRIHAHLQLNRDYGESVDLRVIRGAERISLKMQLPTQPTN